MLRGLETTILNEKYEKLSPIYPVSPERPGRALASRTLPKRGKLAANHDRRTFIFR